MASAEVIVLSSSPSRSLITTTPPRDFDHFLMSSSPSFPSPSQLLLSSRRPSLQSGSRANAIPAGAIKGFTRASCLLDPETIVDATAISLRTASQLGESKQRLRSRSPRVLECEAVEASHGETPPIRKPKAPRKKSEDAREESKTTATKDNTATNGVDIPSKTSRARKSKDVGGNKDDTVRGDPAIKKPRARKIKDDGAITAPANDVVSIKKPRVRKSKDGSTETVVIPGDVPVKKSRMKKNKDEGQTIIAKTRIIKPLAAQGMEDGVKSKETPLRKGTLPQTEPIITEVPHRITVSNEPLGLEVSIPRKRDWTPLRDDEDLDKRKTAQVDDPVLQSTRDALVGSVPEAYKFATLHGDFNYVQPDRLAPATVPQRMVNGEALTKRQKSELIDIPDCPPANINPQKGSKVPKKKPQTITAKATADFRPVAPLTNSSPILQYLAQSSQEAAIAMPVEAIQNHETAKKRARKVSVRPKKPKDTETRAKKSASVLLGPEEAMQATRDQDFLFGTCSQLMREDSPTFVRDLQAAIEASEPLEDITDIDYMETPRPRPSATSLSVVTASKKLWSEAARDSLGELLDVEMIDLANTPNVQQLTKNDMNTKPLRSEKRELLPSMGDKTWKSINDFASPHSIHTEIAPDGLKISGDDVHDSVQSIPRSVAEAALRPRTKSRSPVKKTKLTTASNEPTSDMPRFQAYTTNELGKAISGYGFKAIKSRDAMIVLLEKCWESKARLALQSLTTNANIPNLAPNSDAVVAEKPNKKSPTKRRGRRSKFDGVPTVEEVLAITSVEPSVSPAKARGRPRKNTTLPAAGDSVVVGLSKLANETLPKPTTPSKSKRKAHKPPKDDIEDPNPPPTPSTPRRRTPLSPPQALSLANPALAATKKVQVSTSFSSQTHPDLFAKMTEAVTTFPPTHDPKNLTWYEKILLYDPIVLEDLATWLNTEGLGRVGVDEEVHPGAVRAWCEEYSVCCLWRQNLRGGSRKRY
ncbi:5'-flap endonuclease [Xylographa soralifera]|nr:5'-flap endonuclease [Xylographa soralifera]